MAGGCLAADAVQVGSQGGHSVGVEPLGLACVFCSGHEEAAIFEDATVLGPCRPADRQVLGQPTTEHGRLASSSKIARRVGSPSRPRPAAREVSHTAIGPDRLR
jgi:hypothetical protein